MYEICAYIWLKVIVNVGKKKHTWRFGYKGVSGSGSFSHRGKPQYCDQTPFVSWGRSVIIRQSWDRIWLVVSTHLKNISQMGNLPQIVVKINNIWNHHPGMMARKSVETWIRWENFSNLPCATKVFDASKNTCTSFRWNKNVRCLNWLHIYTCVS